MEAGLISSEPLEREALSSEPLEEAVRADASEPPRSALRPELQQISVEELVKLAAHDSMLFSKAFFPKTVRLESPKMHRRIWDALDNPNIRFVNLRCFRGSAKTTILRLFAAKRIAYNMSRTVLYVGASENHASRSIQWLRGQIDRNKFYAETFGLRKGRKWHETELEIFHSTMDEPIWLLGAGITGNIRGINFDDYRPDLIILDDIVTDENGATQDQREKLADLILGAVKPGLISAVEEPNAKLAMLQTPINAEDISMEVEKSAEWYTEVFPCWTPETMRLPVEQQESSWPELYPTETLRESKLEASELNRLSKWVREWECRLVSAETTAFKAPWLRFWEEPPGLMHSVLAIDPVPPPSEAQLSKNLIGKDYEAQVVVGRRGGEYFLQDYAVNRGHEPNWTVAKALELAHRYRVSRIVVEAVAYQRVIKYLLEQEMQRRGTYFAVIPIVDKRPKYARITNALAGIASQRKLIVSPTATEFISQFEEYPGSAHDDILDALSIGLADIVSPFLELGADDYELLESDEGIESFEYIGGCP